MSRLLSLLAVMMLFGPLPVHAAPTPTELNERLTVLVEQLGDAEFHVREEAERELRKVGIPALDALLTASEHDLDFEVRRRAERLVPEIEAAAHAERLRLFLADTRDEAAQTVPGWKRFKALVGDSLDARRWFVSMHQAEPLVMLRADQRSERSSAAIGERLAYLMRPALRGRTAPLYQLSAPSLTALLFVSSREDVTIHEQVATQLAQVAQGPALSNLLLNATGDEPQRTMVTKILSQWITARSQGWTAISNLHLAQRFQLREAGRAVSREVLGRQGFQPTIRGQALLALERFGTKDDVPLAEACLTEQGACLNFVQNTKRLTVELREVALAVAVLLSGEKPERFGFQELQRVNQQQLLLNSLDLGEAGAIEKAIEKWQARDTTKET